MIYAAFTGFGTRGLPFVFVKFISVVNIYIYIYAHTSWEGTRMNRGRFVGITLMLDNKKNATSNVNKFL